MTTLRGNGADHSDEDFSMLLGECIAFQVEIGIDSGGKSGTNAIVSLFWRAVLGVCCALQDAANRSATATPKRSTRVTGAAPCIWIVDDAYFSWAALTQSPRAPRSRFPGYLGWSPSSASPPLSDTPRPRRDARTRRSSSRFLSTCAPGLPASLRSP